MTHPSLKASPLKWLPVQERCGKCTYKEQGRVKGASYGPSLAHGSTGNHVLSVTSSNYLLPSSLPPFLPSSLPSHPLPTPQMYAQQKEDSHLQAGQTAFTRTQPYWHPEVRLPASRNLRNKFLLSNPPVIVRCDSSRT